MLTLALTIAFSSLVSIAIERPSLEIERKLFHASRRSPAMDVAP